MSSYDTNWMRIGMRSLNRSRSLALALSVAAVFGIAGCNQDQLKQAETSAKNSTDTIFSDVDQAVKKGGEYASELGEDATAYLAPLKEKVGSLDSLKDTPEKLKEAVADIIQWIEDKAEAFKLPETMGKALADSKSKLIELQEYLKGEVEQAKIEEHIQHIKDSFKSVFGWTAK
ncbi:MAG: hypothetical protein ABI557_13650 [Aureliella sp.]